MPLASMAREGVVACMSVAASTSTAVFKAFVEQVLAPALQDRPDAIVVMDNLAAHKAEAVQKALRAAGIAYRYLPAYSPDLVGSSAPHADRALLVQAQDPAADQSRAHHRGA